MRICASVVTTLSRSGHCRPSNLLSSNDKLICRPVADGVSRDCIVFLRNDCDIAPGVCGLDRAFQPTLQLNQRGHVNARRADRHAGANHGIEHPAGDRNHDAGRPLHLKEWASCALLNPTNQNLAAAIWMPSVVDLQFLTDMGRMNG